MNLNALQTYHPANALPDIPDVRPPSFDDLDGAVPDAVDDRLADWIRDNLDVVKDCIELHKRRQQPGCDPYRSVIIERLEEAGRRAMEAVTESEAIIDAWLELQD